MKKVLFIAGIALLAFSCKSKKANSSWPENDRKDFTNNCIETAVQKGMGRDTATSYCNCMLGKLEKKYSKPEEAGNLDMNTMTEMAKDCLNVK